MVWVDSTLGEICDVGGGEIKTGPFGSQLHQSDYEEVGTPVVMPKDIIEGRIEEAGIARVGASHVERLTQHKLKLGDIVYGRRGDIGRQALVRHENIGWLCGTGCLKITLGCQSPIDSRYLHLYLKQDDVVSWIANQAIGATMPNLNTSILRSVPVRYPESREAQLEVVNTLFAYDELIENNTRRITILETMAQNFYREWFVNFRFPGHEQSQWQDTPQGKIPAGWEVKKLSEIAAVNPESITNKNAPEIIYYVDISSVNTGSIEEIKPMDFTEAPSRARRIVRHGDIIWATVRPNRKQFSYIANPVENTIVSTGFAVLRAGKVPASFLYQATTTDSFTAYLVNHATGAAYPAVNASVFENAEILVPDKDLLGKFDDLVAITMKQIEVLKKKNKNLKQQRDILLPKLISG